MSEPKYDPLSDESIEDPFPLYDAFRRENPVFWHQAMGSWVLSKHADCKRVLIDNEFFARDRRRAGIEVPEFRQSLQTLDPPDLQPVKTIFVRAFRKSEPIAVDDEIKNYTRVLLNGLTERSTFDWMECVAAPVALAITSRLMGVQPPSLEHYSEISEGIAYRMDAGVAPERADVGDAARRQLNDLAKAWIESERRVSESFGVLPFALQLAENSGASPHVVDNSIAMMFNASYGTILATLGNVAAILLRYPRLLDEFSQLAPSEWSSASDELMRFDGPAQGTTRVAMKDTVVGGCSIRRGDLVLPLLASANRDPDVFEIPNSINLKRSPNPHLAFGAGAHACLGALLGRASVQIVAQALLDSDAELRAAGDAERRRTATVRCIERLPVCLAPRACSAP